MHRWCLLNLTVQGFSLNLTVRGVSNKHCLLTFFIFAKLMKRERIQTPLKAGHHWPPNEMPFKWRFAGMLMMAQR